jgi:hypothetical protein
VKKTSLISAIALVSMVAGESAAWATSPLTEAISLNTSTIPMRVQNPPSARQQDEPLFTPMSDVAAQGMGCFVATTSSLAAAYAMGPTELMMLVTGAVIVPTTSSLLFIALGGILGAGACGVGAALTPSVLWATENSEGLSEGISEGIKTTLKPKISKSVSLKIGRTNRPSLSVRPMSEGEIQGMGCLVGVLGLGAVALATAPTEAVMLAAGGVGVPSNTPLLMMGMLGTLLPAGCTFGSVASLPLVDFYQNFDRAAMGQKLASLLGWGRSADTSVVQGAMDQPKRKDSVPSLTTTERRLDISMRTIREEGIK